MLKVVYDEKVPVAVVVHEGPEIALDIIKDMKVHGVTIVYRQFSITPDTSKKAE